MVVSHIFNVISMCFYFKKIYMHRKPKAELLPLDTKRERTMRNLRKVKGVESATMENQRKRMQPIPEKAETERPQRQTTMEDFGRPVI